MTPYYVLAAAALVFGVLLGEIKPSRRKDLIYLLFFSGVMLVMATLRAKSVGIDYQSYLNYFDTVCQNDFAWLFTNANVYHIEIGYSLLNWVISLFGSAQWIFALGIGLVIYSLNFLLIWKYSSRVWVSLFVFISFGFFGYTLCTLRQEIGIRLFLLAIPYLQEKKPLPYFLLALTACTFHKSLLVVLPVYFIAWIALNWKTLTLYAVGTFLVAIFSETIFKIAIKYVFTAYTMESRFIMQGRDAITMYIPMALAVIAVVLKRPILERNPKNLPLINFSLYAGLLFILTLKHFVYQRVALIFLPVSILLIPEIVCAAGPDAEQMAELDAARASLNTGNKKANLVKYNTLLAETKDQRNLVYGSIAIVVLYCFMYFGFLLIANRLKIVPFVLA